jgi:hypothetical protein
MIGKAGVYEISKEEYLADPCPAPALSKSLIPLLIDVPIRAWWNHPKLNPQPKEEKDESKFDQGNAAHDLLLEGGKKIMVVEGYDNWKKSAAQEARDAARTIGMIPLLTKQYEVVVEMVAAANQQISQVEELEITDMVAEGDMELSYIWQAVNGIWCKARPDWIRKDRNLICDYKTTGTSANPDDFSGHMNKTDYPIQSVWYRKGVEVVEGVKPDFVFIAQENEPPYLCSFHGIDVMSEDMAREKIHWAVNKWHECLSTGKWPGYPKRICYAEPKPWDLAEWEIKKGRELYE